MADNVLLESGDFAALESGGLLLQESAQTSPSTLDKGFVTRAHRRRRALEARWVAALASTVTPVTTVLQSEQAFHSRFKRELQPQPFAPVYPSTVLAPAFKTPPTSISRFKRTHQQTLFAPEYPVSPSIADIPLMPILPPFGFERRHQVTDAGALLPVQEAQQPPAETFSIDALFYTRKITRRHAQSAPYVPIDTQPVAVPFPSWVPPHAFKSTYKAIRQTPPSLETFPQSPSPPAEPGALLRAVAIKRRPRQGLFLAADGVVEAETVTPPPALLLFRPPNPRPRRRTRFKLARTEALDHIDKAPSAGAETIAAWALPPFHFRRGSHFKLRLPWEMPHEKHLFPGWKLAESFFRRATRFVRLEVPLLSFFQPRPFVLPAFQQWPTLRRRSTEFRTTQLLAPEHVTLRTPPDSQGYPAFAIPQPAYRVTARFHFLHSEAHSFGQAALALRLGLQPPHYVVGRMTEHGKGIKGAMSLAAITVDGRIAPTHAEDGSLDPSEGWGGSVL